MSDEQAPSNPPRSAARRRAAAARRPSHAAGETVAPPAASGFYTGALDDADREAFSAARQVTGLDQEIAVLRLRLRRLLRDHPDDHALAVRAIELLVRAVGTAARVSPAEASGVLEQISAELDGIFTLLADAQAEGE